jgi:hypothetical protein
MTLQLRHRHTCQRHGVVSIRSIYAARFETMNALLAYLTYF